MIYMHIRVDKWDNPSYTLQCDATVRILYLKLEGQTLTPDAPTKTSTSGHRLSFLPSATPPSNPYSKPFTVTMDPKPNPEPAPQLPWSQFLASIVFWGVLLGMKGAFDWFAVIKPLEEPIKALWNRSWLTWRWCHKADVK